MSTLDQRPTTAAKPTDGRRTVLAARPRQEDSPRQRTTTTWPPWPAIGRSRRHGSLYFHHRPRSTDNDANTAKTTINSYAINSSKGLDYLSVTSYVERRNTMLTQNYALDRMKPQSADSLLYWLDAASRPLVSIREAQPSKRPRLWSAAIVSH